MKAYKQRLRRLSPEFYRGFAWVHWTMTLEDRRVGWLDARFLYKFREIHTHIAFRYRLACPVFCLMPEHIHMLWCGLTETTDQCLAVKQMRRATNECLNRIGFSLQRQPYDHVLKDSELERDAIESVIEYIARNPERKGLIAVDEFASYPYSGCLIPGYPQLRLFETESWDRIWRTIAFLKRTECFRIPDCKYE